MESKFYAILENDNDYDEDNRNQIFEKIIFVSEDIDEVKIKIEELYRFQNEINVKYSKGQIISNKLIGGKYKIETSNKEVSIPRKPEDFEKSKLQIKLEKIDRDKEKEKKILEEKYKFVSEFINNLSKDDLECLEISRRGYCNYTYDLIEFSCKESSLKSDKFIISNDEMIEIYLR